MNRPVHILLFLILMMVLPAKAEDQPELPDSEVHLTITQDHWPMTLTARLDILAAPEKVWRVISDYDHLFEFLPDIKYSRVTERNGDKIVLEQATETRFLFFKRTISVKLNLVEKPGEEIAFYSVDGNMELFSGKWMIKGLEGGKSTRLVYMLKFKPGFFSPRWVVRHTLDHEIPEQLQRISRRAQKI